MLPEAQAPAPDEQKGGPRQRDQKGSGTGAEIERRADRARRARVVRGASAQEPSGRCALDGGQGAPVLARVLQGLGGCSRDRDGARTAVPASAPRRSAAGVPAVACARRALLVDVRRGGAVAA